MKLIFLAIFVLFSTVDSWAYFDNYPPYKFKDALPLKHLEAKLLVGPDKIKYKSKDGSIYVRLKEVSSGFNFILRDGKTTLLALDEDTPPLPSAVYQADIDKNGEKDYIVFCNYRGTGIAAQKDKVIIFLRMQDGNFNKISYDTYSGGLEDFVDLDRDGIYEVIITGFYDAVKHNYFSYNIYEFKDYDLVNADGKFRGFPKFIWITNNKNDKDTLHLSVEERLGHIARKNKSIREEEISIK